MPLSYSLLTEQNANTTNAIIRHFADSSPFLSLSSAEGAQILQRDEEDAQKLQRGIDIAKEKGVIDPNFKAEEYIAVDVLGKSPDMVADEILDKVRKQEGEGVRTVMSYLSNSAMFRASRRRIHFNSHIM
jgi:Mg/Co/Ni transporter MgtE